MQNFVGKTKCIAGYMKVANCARRGWRLGTEVNVLKFESAMMCTNNVVFMNPRIMDVVFVISLTHKHFIDPPPPQLRPLF